MVEVDNAVSDDVQETEKTAVAESSQEPEKDVRESDAAKEQSSADDSAQEMTTEEEGQKGMLVLFFSTLFSYLIKYLII